LVTSGLFDEFVRETELGLALHTVCDYLLESETPRPEATTVEQIRALHTSMEIKDDLPWPARQKAGGSRPARREPSRDPGFPGGKPEQ